MISMYHADAIKHSKNCELIGAYDVNQSALNSFCSKYQINAFENPESFITSDKIDAICICLPSGLHYKCAISCIKNKKHVLIEKPIALTVKEADDIIVEANNNCVFASVVSQLRYSDAVINAKKIIEKNELGKITIGNAIMKYYRSPEYYNSNNWRGTWSMDGGGALMNQGIHGIDILQYLMGKVVAVSAVAKTLLHNIEVEDTLSATIEFENGAIGVIQATTSVYPGYNRKIEICGTEGSITLNENSLEICDIKSKELYLINPITINETGSKPDGMDYSLHLKQIDAFAESIINNETPLIDAVEGKKSIEIISAIYQSAKTNKKIYL